MKHQADLLLWTKLLPLLAEFVPRPVRRAVIAKAAAEASFRQPRKAMNDLEPADLMEAA